MCVELSLEIMAMVMKQCYVITVISLLCLNIITTESRTVAVEGNQVKPLSFEMANTMSAKLQSSQKMKLLKLKNTTVSSTLPEKVNMNGPTWCIVKPSTDQVKLDGLIQYSCTQSGVDCKVTNQGGACYNPSNKVSDASVVMNLYYQVNGKHPHNCDFTGSGLIVDKDPSVGPCKYMAT